MSTANKIRIAVLYGGRSGEHEVSLMSATNVIQNLDRSRFDVLPIGIDKEGGWFLGDDILKKELNAPTLLKLQTDSERMLFNPDLIGKALQPIPSSQLIQNADRIFDVVFPVIHGPLCEDGTVQGLLELADVPYVGCGVLSSAVGMDKDVSKRLVKNEGMRVPPYLVLKHGQWEENSQQFCERVTEKLRYPVFVKPANTGSSVGIEKVKNPAHLAAAIDAAFQYDTKIVVEQGIDAIEIEIAVLESLEAGKEPIISVPGEVRPTSGHEFYSYASKYLDEKGVELIIPAPISAELKEKVSLFARNIFMTLECEGMARVDLFLERGTNEIYFNEINSIPGFTSVSMYPKLMAASGMDYPKLLTHLVMLALERYARKAKLSREFLSV
ncbi:MAG: ddlA [Gammaproteobacteria bacterium]|jgi:D-alanine-D-alanine ligase|nr:ddlA [Gammaproteobacteria bacterium]